MKKIRLKRTKKSDSTSSPSRITNETVAEHREKILAGGRKFKYPHQYVKHKLVINALIISVIALVLLVVAGWLALYKFQDTSDFTYRATRVIPVPVASVDGEMVPYSDYLMRYRSQEFALRNAGELGKAGVENDVRQLNFYKRKVLDNLEIDAYAGKRAKELGLSVSSQELDEALDRNRNTMGGRISQEVYDASLKDKFNYSASEYRHLLGQGLLRQKVAYKVDTTAMSYRDEISAQLAQPKPPTLSAIQEQYKKKGITLEFGASGLVPKNNQDYGLSKTALGLKDGQVSMAVTLSAGSRYYGYYFVQRITETDRQISYQYLRVPLTAFDQEFKSIQQSNKIQEFIAIAKT